MNRRELVKQLLVASGGLVALPAWAKDWTLENLQGYSSTFSLTEQQTLAGVADAIIPPGDGIGALSVGVDKFLQKLIENCYDTGVQSNVKSQLQMLENKAQSIHSKSFSECTHVQRQEMLLKLSASENKNEKDFFTLLKSETIRGFSTSKEVMTKYLRYKVAPGHYYGCVDVKS